MEELSEESGTLIDQIKPCTIATTALLQSTVLPRLFAELLLLGNYVNGKSDATGIKLESLERLGLSKCGPHQKTNFLAWLAANGEMSKDKSYRDQVKKELSDCWEIRYADPSTLEKSVNSFGTNVDKLQKLKDAPPPNDIPEEMAACVQECLDRIGEERREMNTRVQALKKTTASLRMHFAEDDKTTLGEILEHIAQIYEHLFPHEVSGKTVNKKPEKDLNVEVDGESWLHNNGWSGGVQDINKPKVFWLLAGRMYPLHVAVQQKEDGVVAWLLQNGADKRLEHCDLQGHQFTPLELAHWQNVKDSHSNIIALLTDQEEFFQLIFSEPSAGSDFVPVMVDDSAPGMGQDDGSGVGEEQLAEGP